jgi:hypothetical protein
MLAKSPYDIVDCLNVDRKLRTNADLSLHTCKFCLVHVCRPNKARLERGEGTCSSNNVVSYGSPPAPGSSLSAVVPSSMDILNEEKGRMLDGSDRLEKLTMPALFCGVVSLSCGVGRPKWPCGCRNKWSSHVS